MRYELPYFLFGKHFEFFVNHYNHVFSMRDMVKAVCLFYCAFESKCEDDVFN